MMRRLTILPVLFVLLIALPYRLLAHGGGQLVAGPEPIGPYAVSVWVNPPQPRAGEPIHFTVGVAAPGDGAPVLDARIQITMEAVDQRMPAASAPATTEQSVNKLFYETDLEVTQTGAYMTTVEVVGPEGEGALAIELDVQQSAPVNWFLIGLGGLFLVLVLGWWRARSTRTPR